jgi:hypothetical protein
MGYTAPRSCAAMIATSPAMGIPIPVTRSRSAADVLEVIVLLPVVPDRPSGDPSSPQYRMLSLKEGNEVPIKLANRFESMLAMDVCAQHTFDVRNGKTKETY